MAKKLTPQDLGLDAIKQYNDEIARLQKTISALKTDLKGLEDVLKLARSATSGSGQQTKEYVDAMNKAQSTIKQLKVAEDDQVKAKIKIQEATKRQKQELQALVQLENAAKGSTERYSAGVKSLELRLRQVNQTTKEGRAEAERLRRGIDKLNESIKNQSSSLGKQRINIGNYKNDIIAAGKEMSAFSKIGAGVTGQLKMMAGAYLGFQGIQKLGSFFSSSIKEADAAIVSEGRLLNALNGRQDIQQRLIASSKELQVRYNIPDDVIVEQQSFLAAQGRTESQIKKTIQAAIQYSSVTGKDLNTAIRELDGTMEGNIGRLAKVDSRFKDLSKTQLENGAAIDLINEKYKGFAEVAAEQGAGRIKQLGMNWDNFKETIGKTILNILDATGAVDALNGMLSSANILLDDSAGKLDKAAAGMKYIESTTWLFGNAMVENLKPLAEYIEKLKELEDKQDKEREALVNASKEIIKLDKTTGDFVNRKEVENRVYQQLLDTKRESFILDGKIMAINDENRKGIATYIANLAVQEKRQENLNKLSFKDKEVKEQQKDAYEQLNEEISKAEKQLKAETTIRSEGATITAKRLAFLKEEKDAIDSLSQILQNDIVPAHELEANAIKETIEQIKMLPISIDEAYNPTAPPPSLIDRLGLDQNSIEAIKQQAAQVLSAIASLYSQLLENKKQAVEEEISISNDRLSSLENDLTAEEELQNKRKDAGAAYDLSKVDSLKKQIAAEKDANNKLQEEKRKIAKQEQNFKVAQALMDTASGIVKIWGTYAANPITAAILTALLSLTTGIQIATIKAQKFAKGGIDAPGSIVEGGRPHSEGGNLHIIETERKELHSILSKEATMREGKGFAKLTDFINHGGSLSQLSASDIKIFADNSGVENRLDHLNKNMKAVKELLDKPYTVGNKTYYKTGVKIAI